MAATATPPRFPVIKKSLHNELRRRVQEYFDNNKIKETGNFGLHFKALLFTLSFTAIYIHLIVVQPVWYLGLIECFILGGIIAAIGFNVMHDGSHGSFSKHTWMNRLAGYSISMLGASHYMWNMKHNVIHHSFTNVAGVDDDIELGKLMRMAPTQERLKHHKFQHIYFWFLYALLYKFWMFFTDYKKYFTGRIGSIAIKNMPLKAHIMFWVVKIYHAAIFVAIPIIFVGWKAWLFGFITVGCTAGFILSIVFQLAHTVEHTEFPVADIDTNKLPDEFAAHQIKTTANFATNNKIISWLVGGLNFQIEHHLFPKISHVHYPAISKIVRNVCVEYNLPYIEYPRMHQAIAAHVRFLKEMGNKD